MVIFLICVVLAVTNRHPVDLYFPLIEDPFGIPLFIFFFFSLICGIVVGGLLTFKYRLIIRHSKKEIKQLQDEVDKIKTLEKY